MNPCATVASALARAHRRCPEHNLIPNATSQSPSNLLSFRSWLPSIRGSSRLCKRRQTLSLRERKVTTVTMSWHTSCLNTVTEGSDYKKVIRR